MSDQLSLDIAKLPTEMLVDQAILKHVSTMKAEVMSIHAREVAGLKMECECLKQELSLLQLRGASGDGRCNKSVIGATEVGVDIMHASSRKPPHIDNTNVASQNNFTEQFEREVSPKSVADTSALHVAQKRYVSRGKPKRPARLSRSLTPELGVENIYGKASKSRMMLETTGWRSYLQTITLHPVFEGLAICVVMLNVVILGVETNQLARQKKVAISADAAFIIEMCCFIFFIFEVGLRILANSKYFFHGPGRVLNILDFILVGLQVFEISLSFVLMGQPLDERRSVNFAMWRILRLARVIRLFRSARLLVMFAEVRSTALAVILAFKPLVGAMIVMLSLCYIFSIVLIELAHQERLELETLEVSDEDERAEQLEFHFGSLGSAIITLLHCSLSTSADYGYKNISSLFTAWWVRDILVPCFMVLSILGMLNIITGIFVDSTTRQVVQDQQSILASIAKDAFKQARRGFNEINHDEFVRVVDSGKCDKLLEVMELEKGDVGSLWSFMCFQAEQEVEMVNVDSLVEAIVKMSGTARRIDLLLILSMLEELVETAEKILKSCVPAEITQPQIQRL